MAIKKLAEMLACNCVTGDQGTAELLESNPMAVTQKITLVGLGTGDLVVMLDEGRKKQCAKCPGGISNYVTPFLKEEKGVKAHRVVDAVVLRKCPTGRFDLFYVDLKSRSTKGSCGQFLSTTCVMRYLADVLKTLHTKDLIFGQEFFILIHAPRLGSIFLKPAFKRPPARMCSPDKPFKIAAVSGSQVDLRTMHIEVI